MDMIIMEGIKLTLKYALKGLDYVLICCILVSLFFFFSIPVFGFFNSLRRAGKEPEVRRNIERVDKKLWRLFIISAITLVVSALLFLLNG